MLNHLFFWRSLTKHSPGDRSYHCYGCGASEFYIESVLWNSLIKEWQLSPDEAEIMNMQQGMKCRDCHTHMRGNVLAYALLKSLGSKSQSLNQLINEETDLVSRTRLLEINEAGNLGIYLGQFPHHLRVEYPQVDMHNLQQFKGIYDIVIHSDTLEHIRNPIHALHQCKNALAEGGKLIYTVPIIPGRMTRDRTGLQESSHSRDNQNDYLVATEFGADFWRYPLDAGFKNISIFSIFYPIAIAITASA